jgi:hypothetical protein
MTNTLLTVHDKPLSAHWGEREGPVAQRWEGEVGLFKGLCNPPPHLTSPPPGAERDFFLREGGVV